MFPILDSLFDLISGFRNKAYDFFLGSLSLLGWLGSFGRIFSGLFAVIVGGVVAFTSWGRGLLDPVKSVIQSHPEYGWDWIEPIYAVVNSIIDVQVVATAFGAFVASRVIGFNLSLIFFTLGYFRPAT